MTELKSIWHKPSKKPTEHKTIFAQHKSLRDGSIECFMWEPQELTDAIRKDIIAWCYLDDLLACEKELIRTRKALEVAWDGLEKIGSGDIIEHSVVGHEDDNKIFIANKALDESKTALKQKDVKC